MAYRVKVSPRSQLDLAIIYRSIRAEHSDLALRWFKGLKEAMQTLCVNPERCPHTPENPALRHLLYGKKPHVYRIIFRILDDPKQVEVIHIRHGAQSPFTGPELN